MKREAETLNDSQGLAGRPWVNTTHQKAFKKRIRVHTESRNLVLLGFALLLLISFFVNVSIGAVQIGLGELWEILLMQVGLNSESVSVTKENVFFAIRLPRTLLGILVGGTLGISGALMQALFRNPLADPGLLGISSGAAAGASLIIVLGAGIGVTAFSSVWALPMAAFLGALLTTVVVWRLGTRSGRSDVTTMLLAGIAINALAGSVTGLMVLVSNDSQLRSLTFWSLGSLNGSLWSYVWIVGFCFCLMVAAIPFLGRPLNALLLGEHDALCLGVRVEVYKKFIIVITSVCVGAAVAFTGMIGFIGLVAPHMVRLMVGPDHSKVLPGSVLLGAILLLNSDLIARTLVPPTEIPIGIVTALIGAPYFLWLLKRTQLRRIF